MTSNLAFHNHHSHHHQQYHNHHHHNNNHQQQQQQQQSHWSDDILPRGQHHHQQQQQQQQHSASRRGETKDSRWLTLEVCLDHLKGTCQKREDECMMAHVPNTYNRNGNNNNNNNNNSVSTITITTNNNNNNTTTSIANNNGNNGSNNGSDVSLSSSGELTGDRRVMCCYDFIKGKCYRKDPPCKFFHPPPHLREVLLHNGRQNLLLKSQRSHLSSYGAVPVLPSAVLPMVYNPTVLNPMLTAKMSEGAQIQFLSNHCVVNQGGMAYFYPFIVGADGWMTVPTNGMQGCQLVPSPPLHGSLKQVDQAVPQLGGYDDVISPWLQNGYSVPSAAVCGPFCYGYGGQGVVKRPLSYDVNKVQ